MQSAEDSVTETHLSYPEPSETRENTPPATLSQPRQLLRDRLYVGNLHSTVDEYVLLQVFSKFGKVSKLDFLFHKSGPMKGKPRGYAFVEFSDPNDAAKALVAANDKLLRGRKLVVTQAQQAPIDQSGSMAFKSKRHYNDANKPTTLSLIKSAGGGRSSATDDKIAKMEAKLRQLEQSSASGSSLAGHSSLPPKPVGALAASGELPKRTNSRRVPSALPSLPLLPQSPHAALASKSIVPSAASGPSSSAHHLPASTMLRKGGNPLAGVIMKKRKEPPS